MWIVALTLIAFGFYYAFLGPRWLMIVGALGCSIFLLGQETIKNDPLEVGLLTFWGRRLEVVIREGNKLLAPFFPFMIGVIKIPVGREVLEQKFEVVARNKQVDANGNVEFQMAGKLSVEISLVFQPDYEAHNAGYRLKRYLISGRAAGVKVMLEQVLVTYTRYAALTHSWNVFMSLKAPLGAAIITKIAGSQMRSLNRVAGTIPANDLLLEGDAYWARPEITEASAVEYLLVHPVDSPEYKNRYREIERFLEIALKNGGGDVLDLGILLQRVNVEAIEPTGDLAAVADDPAVEDVQRTSETKDIATELVLAQMYRDVDPSMSLKDALEFVRVNRGRAKELIVRSSGNPAVDAAALFGNLNH